jgi:quinoprotein glucose dehydrogenase
LHRPLPPRDVEPARQAVLEFLSTLSGDEPEEVQVATINAVASLKIPGHGHAFWDVVYQEGHPVSARIAALHALESTADLRLEVAAQHAGRSDRGELRRAAFSVLARLHPGVSLPVFKDWVTHGAAADLRVIFPLLALISDPRVDEMIAASLQRLRDGNLPAAAAAELLDAAEARQGAQVSTAWKELESHWHESTDPLAPYRSALIGGDVSKGRLLFERHPRLACIQCHEQTGEGTASAVSLESLMRNASAESLLDVVALGNGRCQMPDAAGSVLSRMQLRDLMTYLLNLKQRADAISIAEKNEQLHILQITPLAPALRARN